MDILKEKGFDFGFDPRACKNCPGYCCTGEPGNIWVNKEEIRKIADFLELSSENFIKYYLTKIHYRYSLKELKIRGNYQCVFFDDKKRIVQSMKSDLNSAEYFLSGIILKIT